MAEEKILIDVQVNTAEMQKELSLAINKVESLRESQKLLTQGIIEGKDADGQMAAELVRVSAELEKTKRQVKSQTAIMQAATSQGVAMNASLNEQRQYLGQLQKAYASLSGDAKVAADAEGGLRDQIKQLNDQLYEQEHAIGENGRNVGNYTESIQKAFGALGPLGEGLEGVGLGATSAGKAIKGADKVAKVFAKNPIVGVITLLVAAGSALYEALKKNEQAMGEVQVVTAGVGNVFKSLQPIIQAVTKVLVDILLKAINKVVDAIKWILKGVDKLAAKFGKDLHLSKAFDEGAAAATNMGEASEKAATRSTTAWEKNREALLKLREDIMERYLSDRDIEIRALEKQCVAELKTIGLTEAEKDDIVAYYEEQKAALRDKWRDEDLAAEKAKNDKEAEDAAKALKAREDALKALGLTAKLSQEEAELALAQKYFDTELITYEEHEQAKTLIAEKYANIRAEEQRKEVEQATKLYEQNALNAASATGAALQSLANLFGEFSDESEEAAKAQKAFALSSILVNEAMSIAAGARGIMEASAGAAAAAAATGPLAPITFATYTAEMVGTIISLVASVASTIAEAKQVFSQAGKFEYGGIVRGNSYHGDNNIIRANSGEMMLTKSQQATLFDIANGRTSANNFSLEAMRAAMEAMPAPVLTYQEFARFQQKRTTYKELAKI